MGAPTLNSARQSPFGLTLLTIGFCKDLAGEEKLRAAGVERIWRLGDGNTTLQDAVDEFRGRPGTLAVVDNLRIFTPNNTNKEISAVCAALLRLDITVIDITSPLENMPELQERARKALHASKPIRNHRTARRRGSMGGKAKAANAAARRRAEVSDEIACRVWQSRLTKKEKADILRITISTGDRHYGGR